MKSTFPASLDKLHVMLEFIHKEASVTGFNENTTSKLELAAEEALVNVIKHGYGDSSGPIEIACNQLTSPKKGLEIIISDQGIPFDPLTKAPSPSLDIPIDKKPVGGYGVYLIRKIMDDLRYEYRDNTNIFTLIKYL